ncbi:hypothetical protein AB0E78_40080 [Streptomyces sp. NPDC032198]|uniref:hypothetical protein n=1 Tax=Streptomyces sp. NPDC032198 TaxID=3155127 RepID=UPI00340DE4B5
MLSSPRSRTDNGTPGRVSSRARSSTARISVNSTLRGGSVREISRRSLTRLDSHSSASDRCTASTDARADRMITPNWSP